MIKIINIKLRRINVCTTSSPYKFVAKSECIEFAQIATSLETKTDGYHFNIKWSYLSIAVLSEFKNSLFKGQLKYFISASERIVKFSMAKLVVFTGCNCVYVKQ